jgi:hypothetical protein
MAEIVLVHGIAHEQYSADLLESQWLPALAGGVRNAGQADLADRLWRHGPVAGGIEARMAFYGGLFLRAGAMGAGEEALPAGEEEMAEALAEALLENARERSADDQQRREAERGLREVQGVPGAEAQGPVRQGFRQLVESLARLPFVARLGMGFAETFVWKALAQVTRYFTDAVLREEAQQAVLRLVGPETRAVVGHSLGSVVAYEACHRLDRPLPLLVTLGSPLGLRTIVYDRLRERSFPPRVARWVNVADRNDVVAAAPDLTALFGGVAAGSRLDHATTIDNGAEPHKGLFYLGKVEVGGPVAECLGEA